MFEVDLGGVAGIAELVALVMIHKFSINQVIFPFPPLKKLKVSEVLRESAEGHIVLFDLFIGEIVAVEMIISLLLSTCDSRVGDLMPRLWVELWRSVVGALSLTHQ